MWVLPEIAFSLDVGVAVTAIIAILGLVRRRMVRQDEESDRIEQIRYSLASEIKLNNGPTISDMVEYTEFSELEMFGEKNMGAMWNNYYQDVLSDVPGEPNENMEKHLFAFVSVYISDAYELHRHELYKLPPSVRKPITLYYHQLYSAIKLKQSIEGPLEGSKRRRTRVKTLFETMITIWWWREKSLNQLDEAPEYDDILGEKPESDTETNDRKESEKSTNSTLGGV